jgi:hypothetical protein
VEISRPTSFEDEGAHNWERERDSFFDMWQGFVRYTTMTFICQSHYAMHSE